MLEGHEPRCEWLDLESDAQNSFELEPLDLSRRLRPLVDAVRKTQGDPRKAAAQALATALNVDVVAVIEGTGTDPALYEYRREAVTTAAPPPTAVQPPAVWESFRISATTWGHVLSRGFGADVGGSYALHPIFDLGVAVALGSQVGGQLVVGLHTPTGRVRPFLLLRGMVFPAVPGLAWGAGASAGGSLELGPGRLIAGVGGELYRAPAAYRSNGLIVLLGYEVDLASFRAR